MVTRRRSWLSGSGAACALTALVGCSGQPVQPDPGPAAAPDALAQGAAEGYPVGTRRTWYRQPWLVGSYTAMERIFPMRSVPAAGPVRPLPDHPARRADAGPGGFDSGFVDAYLAQHPASGLLVLHRGRVLVERYQYGRGPQQRFTSFSMAKTVVAMAVGLAMADGLLPGVDTPVDLLDPDLAGTAWQGVTLRQLLTMSSGVRFDETYDRADTDIARLSRPWAWPQGTLRQTLQRWTARDAEPGTRFHYVSADTQVLAQVLSRALRAAPDPATPRTLADYVSARLWTPMGAEADAAWVIDGEGQEAGYCCLSARLRDWGRLGLLLAESGARDGQAVLPADWVRAATRAQAPHLQARVATPYLGYGYQTWLLPDGLGFALLGVHGQAVYVHPGLGLVMVQTGVWPTSSSPALGRQRDAFWRQLLKRGAAWTTTDFDNPIPRP